MNYPDRFREIVPEGYDQAVADLSAQGLAINALTEARRTYSASIPAASKAVQHLLSVICKDTDTSLMERAGWSTAFHTHRGKLTSIEDFAEKASEYHDQLKAIDKSLRPAGTPILGISPGSIGDFRRDPNAMRYAIARTDGSGLHIKQVYNDAQNWFYHLATVPEQKDGRVGMRGFINGRNNDALISGFTTDSLVQACADPAAIADRINNEDARINPLYVIGEEAIAGLFDESALRQNQKYDMLRGAVALAGIAL